MADVISINQAGRREKSPARQSQQDRASRMTSGFVAQVKQEIWMRWWYRRELTRDIRHNMRIDGPDARLRVELAVREEVSRAFAEQEQKKAA